MAAEDRLMTKFVAIVYEFEHPTKLINLTKRAYWIESNSKANAKEKFIKTHGKHIPPMRNSRYPVEIVTVGEYIRMWERLHPSFVTEGWQLVSHNNQRSWAISTKNAKNSKSVIEHYALNDIGSGRDFQRSVPPYK
jgi:hypothetical protein